MTVYETPYNLASIHHLDFLSGYSLFTYSLALSPFCCFSNAPAYFPLVFLLLWLLPFHE